MQISQHLVQNFKKLSGSQKLQIAYWNEYRHNAEPSQCITKLTTDDRQYSWWFPAFRLYHDLMFDNIPKDQSSYYLRKESIKECQEETTQNKADKLLTSLQRDNRSRRQEKNRVELKLTFTKLFCNR